MTIPLEWLAKIEKHGGVVSQGVAAAVIGPMSSGGFVTLPHKGVGKPTEAEFTQQVIDLARLSRWRAAHFRPAMTKDGKWVTAVQGDGKGFPDLILVRGGSLIVAELKVGKNTPTREHAEWLAAFAAAGVPAYTWRPGDWAEIVSTLT